MATKDRERIVKLGTAFRAHQEGLRATFATPPTELLAAPPTSAMINGRRSRSKRLVSTMRPVVRKRKPIQAFMQLFKRAALQVARDKQTNMLRLGATVGLAFIFGAQFGMLDGGGAPTAKSVASRVALLSYGVISMGMLATMRALDRFAKERPIVGRERAEGKYTGLTYLLAKAIAEVPSDAFFAALFAVVLKGQCGLHAPLGPLVAVHALLAATSAALGLAVGAAAPRAEQALAVGAPIMVIHMLVGVIDPAGASSEPDGPLMRTLRLLSPVRHAIEALCLSELKDVPFKKAKGLFSAIAQGPSMGALAGVRSGNDVLDKLGIVSSFASPVKYLLALGAFHLAGSALALIFAAPRFARTKPPKEESSVRATPAKRGYLSSMPLFGRRPM